MKLTVASCHFHLLFLLLARAVTSQSCQTSPDGDGVYPNCTESNSAFCEGGAGSTIIFRCFYPYGHACPGNCMDNLDEHYRDAACWESDPGAGDAQCAAGCVSVTAKNGSSFYPFGCDGASASSSVTGPLSTTTSIESTSTTPLSPASTTTAQSGSVTTSAKSDAIRRVDTMGVAFGMGCVINLAAQFAR